MLWRRQSCAPRGGVPVGQLRPNLARSPDLYARPDKQTSRPVTSAEAGGSGDAFPALQHFSRLSVDRANQLCPGPSIPVPQSPFLISTRAFPRARNNTLYSLPGTARSIATPFEEPPQQGHGSAGWLAGCRLPSGVCWWACGLATIHLQHNSSTRSATVYTHAADGLLCRPPLRVQPGGARRSSAALFHVSTQTQPLPGPCMPYHDMARYVRHTAGRLIQVTVCELDDILSFGPSQEPGATSQKPADHPPARDRTKDKDCALDRITTTITVATSTNTAPMVPSSRVLNLEPRGPALALGLDLASRGLISLPGPSPHIQRLPEMNMDPSAIIHARTAGLFHPNQPLHTLLQFRAALTARATHSPHSAGRLTRNQISPISPGTTTPGDDSCKYTSTGIPKVKY